MQNQIQLYHDASAFYLDREWQLKAKVQKLQDKNQQLRAEKQALVSENTELKAQCQSLRESLQAKQKELDEVLNEVRALRKVFDEAGLHKLTCSEIEAIISRLWGLWKLKLDATINQELQKYDGLLGRTR